MKIAFINGRLSKQPDGSTPILNILLGGGKVMGLGYLPDEEEKNLETIDIGGCSIEVVTTLELGSIPSFNVIAPSGNVTYQVVEGHLQSNVSPSV